MFGVVQEQPDGKQKLRPVDNFSWSAYGSSSGRFRKDDAKVHSVNGHTAPSESMKHDTLDALAATMRCAHGGLGDMGLFKADVDAAFRRILVKPSHRWACAVAFRVIDEACTFSISLKICQLSREQVYMSAHAAAPFGAVASVHAWARIGEC